MKKYLLMSSAAIVIFGFRVEVTDIHFAAMYGTFWSEKYFLFYLKAI